MELSKDTVRKIRGLILFAVAVVVAAVNYEVVLSVCAYLLGILTPFLVGGAIGFVLNVPMRFLEKHIGPRMKHKKAVRPLCLVLTLLLVIGLVGIVMVLVVPELFRTIMSLENSVPVFFSDLQRKLERVFADYPEIEYYISSIQVNWGELVQEMLTFLSHGAGTVLSTTVSAAVSLVNGVASFGIGLVFAIYILLQKEALSRQAKKLCHAFLPDRLSFQAVKVAALTEHVFSNFLTGQCLEAVILGCMFFVTLSVLRMPYALLIGVLIGFTALVPIFGAFIGCAVGTFLILLVSPVQALIFIGVFLVLQQVEGNLIYPHVVGGSVGLPSIWVLVAVTLGGSLMGLVGMLIFIPLTSVFYTLLRETVNARLERKKEGAGEAAKGQEL